MTQLDDIDECTLRVNADRELVADGQLRSAEIERLAGECVNIDRLAQSGHAAAARKRNVDTRRDNVREAVAGKCCDPAERASRGTRRFSGQLGLFDPAPQLNWQSESTGLEAATSAWATIQFLAYRLVTPSLQFIQGGNDRKVGQKRGFVTLPIDDLFTNDTKGMLSGAIHKQHFHTAQESS
jgi:hypothetical protein